MSYIAFKPIKIEPIDTNLVKFKHYKLPKLSKYHRDTMSSNEFTYSGQFQTNMIFNQLVLS